MSITGKSMLANWASSSSDGTQTSPKKVTGDMGTAAGQIRRGENGLHGGATAHGVASGIHASGIQSGIGFQHVVDQGSQSLGFDADVQRAQSVVLGGHDGDVLMLGQAQQADLVYVLTGIVVGAMDAQDQRYGAGSRRIVEYILGQVFKPGLMYSPVSVA